MGSTTEQFTKQSAQFTKTILKSISGLALVSVFFFAASHGIHVEGKVSPDTQSAQVRGAKEFYIALSTDERDRPGLSTLVVAGSNRLLFDCGVVEPVPGGDGAPVGVTALFLTHLDTTTADEVDPACGAARTAQLPMWGPPGKWMHQTAGDRALDDSDTQPVSVIDVREGVTVAAIETAPSRFAYRVGFEGRSVLIASDGSYSEHLVALSRGVDILVLRYSDITETIGLLQLIRPRLAVLSPDGKAVTVAQIREHYAGAVQLFNAGAHRIHVREPQALDDDIKEPQR